MLRNFNYRLLLSNKISTALVVLMVFSIPSVAENIEVKPYEISEKFIPQNKIDSLVNAKLKSLNIEPAKICSDEVFIRRLYLDVIGTLPNGPDVRRFVRNRNKNKRSLLIDELLQRDEFADYWSLKWCDILRVKAEFPINLWPNGVQAYHRWIYQAIRDDMPYDEFARHLLTSSGSNFRVPPVNFYRAIQGREPSAIANAVALTFMGIRLENWPENKRMQMKNFFSRVAFKSTAEWKEEIVYLDPSVKEPLKAAYPDGTEVTVPADKDPRKYFADWLVKPENPYFTKNIVNRIWSWFFGRGIIHEPDDIRPDNPPVNEELVQYLEKEFIKVDYDLKHIYRLILNSRTYQQSCIPRTDHKKAEKYFACYSVRRLDAEVLIDALHKIFGGSESYKSMIPEPFTFVPEENRTIELADGSIKSQFLEMFGRPTRDTGLESERNNEPSDSQRLYLLNSSHIQDMIQKSPKLRLMLRLSKNRNNRLINIMYMNLMSRSPTNDEIDIAKEYLQKDGINKKQAATDLAWALINTKEFLYRH